MVREFCLSKCIIVGGDTALCKVNRTVSRCVVISMLYTGFLRKYGIPFHTFPGLGKVWKMENKV